MPEPDAYRAAGVDYAVLDAAKRRALEAVRASLGAPARRGAAPVEESIGEPAQLVELGGGIVLGTVLECLGTKSEIAREVEASLGLDRWDAIGVDALAAIVNDLCCAGVLPLTVSAYLATGSAAWYEGGRHASFVAGWARACATSGAAFVGGESPTLAGIVAPGSVDIAGSAVGRVPAGAAPWLGSRLEAGDEIVLLASAGLHANGATLARAVAARSVEGWGTPLPSGRSAAEAVLDPSRLYVDVVEALQAPAASGQEGAGGYAGAVHYASHITGHGLRKLMRADRELTYRVRSLPEVPEVLAWVTSGAGLDDQSAYSTLNMGAGFALFTREGTGAAVAALAERLGHRALLAGTVEDGPRRVVLEPVGVTYSSEELELR